MKISIISTSHRKNSESIRISEIMKKIILKIDKDIKCYNLDMLKKKIPLWTSDKEKNSKFWDKEFKNLITYFFRWFHNNSARIRRYGS